MSIADVVLWSRRDFLDDMQQGRLWSDIQLTEYVKEAITEACIRSNLFNKSSNISVVAGTSEYDIDPTIRQIYIVKPDLSDFPIPQATDSMLSLQYGSAWRTQTGTPKGYVRRGHKITLFPTPIANDTVVITSSNVPDWQSNAVTFDLDSDIDPIYHKSLCFYVVYKALMLRDADAMDVAKAQNYLQMFNAAFGVKHSAKHDSVNFETPIYSRIRAGRMC